MAFGLSAGAAALVGAIAAPVVGSLMAPDPSSGGQAAGQASQMQAEMAKEQWDRYKTMYGPLEQEYVDQAQGMGSQANQNKASEQAAADVAAKYAGARQRLNDTPGANPSSEAALRANNDLNLSEAAASATGQTTARQNVVQQGRAAMTDAVSLGKGLPASASGMLSSASSGMLAAAQYQNGLVSQTASGIGGAVTGAVKAMSGMGSGGGIDNYQAWNDSPMASTIYSNGSLAD